MLTTDIKTSLRIAVVHELERLEFDESPPLNVNYRKQRMKEALKWINELEQEA